MAVAELVSDPTRGDATLRGYGAPPFWDWGACGDWIVWGPTCDGGPPPD